MMSSSDANRERALGLRAEGWTLQAIGDELGMSRAGVSAMLQRQPRPCARCGKLVYCKGAKAYCREPCLPAAKYTPTGRGRGRPRGSTKNSGKNA